MLFKDLFHGYPSTRPTFPAPISGAHSLSILPGSPDSARGSVRGRVCARVLTREPVHPPPPALGSRLGLRLHGPVYKPGNRLGKAAGEAEDSMLTKDFRGHRLSLCARSGLSPREPPETPRGEGRGVGLRNRPFGLRPLLGLGGPGWGASAWRAHSALEGQWARGCGDAALQGWPL